MVIGHGRSGRCVSVRSAMDRVVERLEQQLATLRSGRASAGMLDRIQVRGCRAREQDIKCSPVSDATSCAAQSMSSQRRGPRNGAGRQLFCKLGRRWQ